MLVVCTSRLEFVITNIAFVCELKNPIFNEIYPIRAYRYTSEMSLILANERKKRENGKKLGVNANEATTCFKVLAWKIPKRDISMRYARITITGRMKQSGYFHTQ